MICHQLPNSRNNALRKIFEDLFLLNYHLVQHHMILKAAWCIDTWRVDTILKGCYEPPHSNYDMNWYVLYIHIYQSLFQKIYPLYTIITIYFCIAFTYRHLLRPFPSSTLTSTVLSHTFQKYILFCTPENQWRNGETNKTKPKKSHHLTSTDSTEFHVFFFKSSFIFSVLPFLSVTFVELSTVWTRKMGQKMWGYQT